MWYCRNCRHEFEEPQIWDGESFAERYGICPICGHDDIVEMTECDECGELFDPDTMIGPLCENCYELAVKEAARDYLADTEQEKEFAEWYSSL